MYVSMCVCICKRETGLISNVCSDCYYLYEDKSVAKEAATTVSPLTSSSVVQYIDSSVAQSNRFIN